jgi:PAS domain S-box-containing protein
MSDTPLDLNLLICEDRAEDVELVLHELRRAGIAPRWRCVESEPRYVTELDGADVPQVILADYNMPAFNALRALRLLRQRQLDIPFIVVTGTISEETAVHCIKEGADDYLIKDRLARLGPAILHALEEKRLRDEKRFAESALRQSEQRYRMLVEHSPDAILVVAHDGCIVYINDAGARLLGAHERKELLGRPFLEFVQANYRDQVMHRIAEMLDRGRPTPLMEQQLIRLDGALVDVEVSGTPCIYDGSPAIQRIVRDITERRRAQEEARQRLAELTHVIRLTTMGELVSELAHEINQPLYAISNFAEACLNRFRAGTVDQTEVFSWIEQIATQANRAGEILRRVGRFLRKSPPRQIPGDMNQLVRGVLELLQFDLRRGQTSLQWDLAEPLPPVKIDSIQIEQVLVNLIRNAIEAMAANPPGDRALLLRTEFLPPDRIRVAVQDGGRGIDLGQMNRLFEPFFTTKADGMGMGLAISHSIIQSHGGTLVAVCNPDRGLTFQFTLPILARQTTDGNEPSGAN